MTNILNQISKLSIERIVLGAFTFDITGVGDPMKKVHARRTVRSKIEMRPLPPWVDSPLSDHR